MAISAETREQVRKLFAYRYGYCGVHEHDVGSELEIDHFQPRSQGGLDDLDNLVYCCSACNLFKQGYWPAGDGSTNPRRFLHPLKDKLEEHLVEDEDGQLRAISETGAFHLARFRLNRPQLRALRAKQRLQKELRAGISAALAKRKDLDESESELTDMLNEVWAQLERLRNP